MTSDMMFFEFKSRPIPGTAVTNEIMQPFFKNAKIDFLKKIYPNKAPIYLFEEQDPR